MLDEGYIFIATRRDRYVKQAISAAKSIRFFDKTRPIHIATDIPISTEDARKFDSVIEIERRLNGTENHLYLNELSRFDRTLYVDSDCLASNPRLLTIWEEIRKYNIAFPGEKVLGGKWRINISEARKRFNIDYIVRCNGGVFGFDKSKKSQEFFRCAQRMFEKKVPEVRVKHGSGGGYANEPIWGTSLAINLLPIFPMEHALAVSTRKLDKWEITNVPSIRLSKYGKDFDPIFSHFLGLGDGLSCPVELYDSFLKVLC